MSTEPSSDDTREPDDRTLDEPGRPDGAGATSTLARLGADWIAVIVAGVLVVLAGLGLLPTIPFLIK